VVVSGNPVQLTGRWIGTFVLTAGGGTVDFTITLPSDPTDYGDPTVSPASGTLAAGKSEEVEVHIMEPWTATHTSLDLIVDPGDIQVSVIWPTS
jgi:hypothetical protein